MAEKRPTAAQLAVLRAMLGGCTLEINHQSQCRTRRKSSERTVLNNSEQTVSLPMVRSLLEKGFIAEATHQSKVVGTGWVKTFALAEAGGRWAQSEE